MAAANAARRICALLTRWPSTPRSGAAISIGRAPRPSITRAVAQLKAATDLPIAVGFGVRTPEQAAQIGRVADGVVVGSAIVELVGKYGADAPAHVRAYIQSLSAALAAPKEVA